MAAQWPTPGDRREDHALAAGERIGTIYARAEMLIISTIASLARKVAGGSMPAKAAARQARATTAEVLDQAAPQARQVLDDAMNTAAAEARAGLRPTLPLPGHAPTVPLPEQATQDLAALIDSATGTAEQAVQNTVDAITTATAAITEASPKTAASATGRLITAPGTRLAVPPPPDNPYTTALGNALGKYAGFPGQSLSYRRLQAAQEMLDELAAKGITGFTDKAGRKWDLATYVEMATRTAVSNAWDDMQAAAAIRSGLDLVQTGTHSTEGSCALCLPWLNRTLSLTGATEGYPTVDEAKAAGWRHPNCRCFWTVIGGGYMADVTNPVPLDQALQVYKHSQDQRVHERAVRAAGRAAQAAVTPQAKARARRDLANARAASAAHRQQHQLRIMQVTTKRREMPYGPR